MPYILDETEEAVVTSLPALLTEIKTVTKTLQQERGVPLSDIRALFDALICFKMQTLFTTKRLKMAW